MRFSELPPEPVNQASASWGFWLAPVLLLLGSSFYLQNPTSPPTQTQPDTPTASATATPPPAETLRPLVTNLQENLASELSKGQAEISFSQSQVRLHLQAGLFFDSGSALFQPRARALLRTLGRTLQENSWKIDIEGHTDGKPLAFGPYPTNWELSSAQASQLARELIRVGLTATNLRAIGRADTAPRSNFNRRIDLIIYTSGE